MTHEQDGDEEEGQLDTSAPDDTGTERTIEAVRRLFQDASPLLSSVVDAYKESLAVQRHDRELHSAETLKSLDSKAISETEETKRVVAALQWRSTAVRWGSTVGLVVFAMLLALFYALILKDKLTVAQIAAALQTIAGGFIGGGAVTAVVAVGRSGSKGGSR